MADDAFLVINWVMNLPVTDPQRDDLQKDTQWLAVTLSDPQFKRILSCAQFAHWPRHWHENDGDTFLKISKMSHRLART